MRADRTPLQHRHPGDRRPTGGADALSEQRGVGAVRKEGRRPRQHGVHHLAGLTARQAGRHGALLEALGDHRHQAREMVHAVLAGTAALLEDGTDPAVLRQRVSSPAGTTIAGVAVLELSLIHI